MKNLSRRQFLEKSAALGVVAATTGVSSALTSCSGAAESGETTYTPLKSDIPVYIPECGDKAIGGQPVRAGLIGCGSRGGGAAFNFLSAGDGLSIVAAADVFEDKAKSMQARLKKAKNDVKDANLHFGSFDSYKKVCEDPNVDMVIVGTPSIFHAIHVKYAIECGKHVFCEKAAGIDPVSCRLFSSAIQLAKSKNLSIVTGAQRHNHRSYIEGYKMVRSGMIGEITSGVVKWNQGHMNYAKRRPEWTDMEYMIRDFFSWNWLCGDHVIDQLVHNIDVFQWFSHLKPVSAVGMGSQLQRRTGDIFDNFGIDIVYEGNVRVNAQARQIDGCAGDVSETIFGTKGYWTSKGHCIYDYAGNVIWKFDAAKSKSEFKQHDPYVLEHMDLINHIRSNKQIICNAETLVVSSLTGAMCREAAYTGALIKYDEYQMSDQSLMLPELHFGNIPDFEKKFVAPKQGKLAPEKKIVK